MASVAGMLMGLKANAGGVGRFLSDVGYTGASRVQRKKKLSKGEIT